MSIDLAKFGLAVRQVIEPSNDDARKIQASYEKMISAVVVKFLSLHDARRMSGDNKKILIYLLESMSASNLTKLNKAWDKHHTLAKTAPLVRYLENALALLDGREPALDPAKFTRMPLSAARAAFRDDRERIGELVGRKMTPSQLTSASKKWNPHRKVPREVAMTDIRKSLMALLDGAEPDAAPPPTVKAAPKPKPATKSATGGSAKRKS